MIARIKRYIRIVCKKEEREKWKNEIKPRVRIIKDIKDYAHKESNGNEVECIKIANKMLKETYTNRYFSDNLDYLYARYVDLERREPIFSEILFPSFIAILSLDSIKEWFRQKVAEILLLQEEQFMEVSELLTESYNYLCKDNLLGEKIVFVALLIVYFLLPIMFVYTIYRLMKSIFQLFTRNAFSTILETEISLLRKILIDKEILSDS